MNNVEYSALVSRGGPWMSERMKSRVWEDNRRALLQYILHVNSKFGRQHTKAPLAAVLSPFMSLLYPPNPWCDEWTLATTPGSTPGGGGGGGALGGFLDGNVPPGTPNWHPVFKKNSPKIDTPF